MKLTHLFKRDPAAAEQLVRWPRASVGTVTIRETAGGTRVPGGPPPPAATGAFTWAAAQQNMRRCMNGHTSAATGRFRWRTPALGNALNGWMHVFLYALASGRQLVAGDGLL